MTTQTPSNARLLPAILLGLGLGNGARDAGETDIDCGGACASTCPSGDCLQWCAERISSPPGPALHAALDSA